MAVIENYSSQRPLPVNRSSAQDFADTRGLENLARAADESSKMFQQEGDRLAQVQELEDKLVIARKMAEFDQQWVIELKNRQQAVEEGRMSASGMTEMFQKDYGKASDELAATIPNRRMSEETRIRLIERQTSMIGSLMDFEARKRAEGIRQNYEGMRGISYNMLITAQDPIQLEMARTFAYNNAKLLPADLAKEYIQEVDLLNSRQLINFAKTPEEAKEASDAYFQGGIITDQGAVQIGNALVAKRSMIESQAADVVTRELASHAELSGIGQATSLMSPEFYNSLSVLSPEDKAKVQDEFELNVKINEERKKINQTDQGFMSTYKEYTTLIENAKSQEERLELTKAQAGLVVARNKRNELISQDPAAFANQHSPQVVDAQELYSANQTEENRNNVYDSMDNYFKQIGYSGDVNYLTKQEAANYIGNIKKSLLKKDGVMDVEQQMAQLTQTYGKRIGSVMKQLVAEDKDTLPAVMMTKIVMNGGDRNVAMDIAASISAFNIDPKAYKLDDKEVIPDPPKYTKVISAMDSDKMWVTERLQRRETYEQLYKFYRGTGYTRSDASTKAAQVYSDMRSDGTIIVPAAYKSTSDIKARAYRAVADFISKDLAEMPEYTNQYSKQDILQNPAAVIEWRNTGDGEGLYAVWAGSNNNPVVDKFGNELEYKYIQYDKDSSTSPYIPNKDVPPSRRGMNDKRGRSE